MRARGWRSLAATAGLMLASACATAPASTPPPAATTVTYDVPDLRVQDLLAAPELEARHEAAFQRLRRGDLRGAARDFEYVLQRSPAYYPAATGLGYVALYERRYDDAAQRFDAVTAAEARYLPALLGRLDVALAQQDDRAAVTASERVLAVDPDRADVRSQYEVLRLQVIQRYLAEAAAAREASRWDDAQSALDAALVMMPESAVVLRELARVEIARGRLAEAEGHAARSLELDLGDAEAHAVMATVLEAQGRLRPAADALRRAVAIDPREEWRERAAALTARADFNALPAEYRAIPSASAVTRGQAAAMFGIRLEAALARVPRRLTAVITDVRAHWAERWILSVTAARWMEPFENHTFQPSAVVRRAELAEIVWRALQDVAAGQSADLARWRSSRPAIADVPRTHLSYAAISAAVASGAMGMVDGNRFEPGRPAAGAELVAALARLEQLAGSRGTR